MSAPRQPGGRAPIVWRSRAGARADRRDEGGATWRGWSRAELATSGRTWCGHSSEAGTDVVVIDDLSSGHREFVPDCRALLRGHDPRRRPAGAHLRRERHHRRRARRRLQVRRGLGAAPAAHLRAERDGDGRAAGAPWRMPVSAASCSPRAPPSTARPTPTSSPRRRRRTRSRPYGESKLIGEWLLRDQEVATGLAHTSLRYFNVVGSGRERPLRLEPAQPLPAWSSRPCSTAARRASTATTTRRRTAPACATTSTWPTWRSAHVVAAQRLDAGEPIEAVYNLGSGDGVSVGEIMSTIAGVTGIDFEPEIAPRRAGDPARIVASGEQAARDLDWRMRHTLERDGAERVGLPAGGGTERRRRVATAATRPDRARGRRKRTPQRG